MYGDYMGGGMTTLFYLAIVGLLTSIGAVLYGLYWLTTHVRIVL